MVTVYSLFVNQFKAFFGFIQKNQIDLMMRKWSPLDIIHTRPYETIPCVRI